MIAYNRANCKMNSASSGQIFQHFGQSGKDCGAILLAASVVIIVLTLMQHTHGQGLSGAINGGAYGANNARLTPADQMLAKVTRIAGVVFFVVAVLACVFASRLA